MSTTGDQFHSPEYGHRDRFLEYARALEVFLRESKHNEGRALYQKVYKQLEYNLGVLNNKASVLLTFNAIMLAAIGLYKNQREMFDPFLGFSQISLLVSALCCLLVVRVYFPAKITLNSREACARKYYGLVRHRTTIYRVSWWLSVLPLVALMTILITNAF